MDEYRRIYIPFSQEEFIALSKAAQEALRHPRDQARLIIRSALLGESPPKQPKENTGAGKVRETRTATGVTVNS